MTPHSTGAVDRASGVDNPPAHDRRIKCEVREGRFVEPCATLAEQADHPNAGFTKAKGIARWHYTNLESRKPSRTFFGAKTKASPDGFLFNFCPYCGARIDEPFASEDDATRTGSAS